MLLLKVASIATDLANFGILGETGPTGSRIKRHKPNFTTSSKYSMTTTTSTTLQLVSSLSACIRNKKAHLDAFA